MIVVIDEDGAGNINVSRVDQGRLSVIAECLAWKFILYSTFMVRTSESIPRAMSLKVFIDAWVDHSIT